MKYNKQFIGYLVLAALGISVQAKTNSANPTPLGIEIGVSKCEAARSAIKGGGYEAIGNNVLKSTSIEAESVYPNASEISILCKEDTVLFLTMEINKGGIGNPVARETFATLKGKYKLIEGGPAPSVGNGFAKFAAGNGVITLNAPHMAFSFILTYTTQEVAALISKAASTQAQALENKKRNGL